MISYSLISRYMDMVSTFAISTLFYLVCAIIIIVSILAFIPYFVFCLIRDILLLYRYIGVAGNNC